MHLKDIKVNLDISLCFSGEFVKKAGVNIVTTWHAFNSVDKGKLFTSASLYHLLDLMNATVKLVHWRQIV